MVKARIYSRYTLEAAALLGKQIRLGRIQCQWTESVLPRRLLALQVRYEALLQEFSTIDMPEPVYLMAAGLGARFGLKTPGTQHPGLSKEVLPGL